MLLSSSLAADMGSLAPGVNILLQKKVENGSFEQEKAEHINICQFNFMTGPKLLSVFQPSSAQKPYFFFGFF